MVSAMGTEQADPDSDEVFQVYLRAEQAADDNCALAISTGRSCDPVGSSTMYRPATCRSATSTMDQVTRGDVAHVLAEVIEADNTIGKTFDGAERRDPIKQAIAEL